MTKPELGIKRLCVSCGAKFYDLNTTPITCPKCETVLEVVQVAKRLHPDQRAATRKIEFEAEKANARAPAANTEESEEAETKVISEDDAESRFIVAEEDDDTDVVEIIGGDVKDNENT
jgi:uncharacterized protein (TIGR02300 family)